jgi:hypothetical protein
MAAEDHMKTYLILCAAALLGACAKPAAAPKAASKPAAQQLPVGSSAAIEGEVLERLDAGGFTYLRLKTNKGERWLVTSPVETKVGEKVSASSAMIVEKFESKSLNRTFDNIIFGSVDGAKAAAHASAPSPMKDVGDVKVDKAAGAGAKTVAEIWATRAGLKDQTVVVRGKVVKFLPSIMGKNWMHVRDGSGSRGKGDDDIAVISDDHATVGSVVTLTGTVRLDKDFGAGYQYAVIIEDAKLK